MNSVCIGGLHRLRLLEPLLPFADELKVFAHPTMQSTIWQLYFGPVRFSLSLSRECWRGFSGEGAALESLLEDVPERWIEAMDKYSYANQQFNPTLFAIEEHIDLDKVDSLSARLAAMGLLGFDLDENRFLLPSSALQDRTYFKSQSSNDSCRKTIGRRKSRNHIE